MAIVNIHVEAYSNPPLYNAIQLAFFASDQVCYKPKSAYQISTPTFVSTALIYKVDNSLAPIGWYSDGHNRAQWNGSAIILFIPCEVDWDPSGAHCTHVIDWDPSGATCVTT
jgi:hypothetical protein